MWAAKQDMAAAGGGAIVNVSSLGGINPWPDMIGYGGIEGRTQPAHQSAMALAPLNIRVNAVAGVVATPRALTLSDGVRAEIHALIPLGRPGTPEEIANLVVFVLSDAASFITGSVVVATGGQSRGHLPDDSIMGRRRRAAGDGRSRSATTLRFCDDLFPSEGSLSSQIDEVVAKATTAAHRRPANRPHAE